MRPATSNRTSRALFFFTLPLRPAAAAGAGSHPAVGGCWAPIVAGGFGLVWSGLVWSCTSDDPVYIPRYMPRLFGCVVVSSHLRLGIGGIGHGMVRLSACLAVVRWLDGLTLITQSPG